MSTQDACGSAFGYRPLDEEGYERLHTASLRVLETVGVEVRDERGRALLARAGAAVESSRVRIPRQVIEGSLESLPKCFTLHGRADDGSLDLDVALGHGYWCVPASRSSMRARRGTSTLSGPAAEVA
jgi:trimethylamine--corrinoid protein Co-methyltransferase